MDLEELHMWDLYTPLVKDEHGNIRMKKLHRQCWKAFHPLGEEYVSIVKEGLENRWVDVVKTKENVQVLILQVHMEQTHIF